LKDGRIHNILKVYSDSVSIFLPKVPIEYEKIKKADIKEKINPTVNPTVKDVDWLEKSINRTHSKLKDYILTNEFTHFATFTISPDVCDRYDDTTVRKKIKSFHTNIRRNSSLGYITVPERHKDGALHFHTLFSNFHLELHDTGHKDSSGRTRYNIKEYNLGFHDITVISDIQATANYVRKYISKSFYSNEPYKQRYFASQNLKKPEVFHNMDLNDLPLDDFVDLDYGLYGTFSI